MSFGRKRFFAAISAAALGGAALLPMATGFASETADATVAEADAELIAATGIATDTDNPFTTADDAAEPTILLDDGVLDEEKSEEHVAAETTINDTMDDELDCLAKTISHEARNQPYEGQLAVAQVIMNRVESPLFPNSICGVVHQRHQFSNIHSYNPRRSGALWDKMVDIAIDARNGVSEPVVGEALYFHAARIRPAFTRRLTRVSQLGDHIFSRR